MKKYFQHFTIENIFKGRIMKIPAINTIGRTLIKPKASLFNPKRVVYEIGQATMYSDAGKGSVYLGKDGTIFAYKLNNLGICTLGNDFAPKHKIIVQSSHISSDIAIRKKDTIALCNCTLPHVNPPAPKFKHITKIIYTNKTQIIP